MLNKFIIKYNQYDLYYLPIFPLSGHVLLITSLGSVDENIVVELFSLPAGRADLVRLMRKTFTT